MESSIAPGDFAQSKKHVVASLRGRAHSASKLRLDALICLHNNSTQHGIATAQSFGCSGLSVCHSYFLFQNHETTAMSSEPSKSQLSPEVLVKHDTFARSRSSSKSGPNPETATPTTSNNNATASVWERKGASRARSSSRGTQSQRPAFSLFRHHSSPDDGAKSVVDAAVMPAVMILGAELFTPSGTTSPKENERP
ncbi:hypothetical protein K490DRAFT_54906 [Saccharata proteae CBS 121410]|uniref:Uncharacterized protein n=1 Tax=Saccharata proteae CBS 121410 TaxID=1314787 RepID=A0A6A5YE82_9PEZI|nr:hypothetical protein K490DRAFT_54906 [Saccharata proteae CBS 121410]